MARTVLVYAWKRYLYYLVAGPGFPARFRWSSISGTSEPLSSSARWFSFCLRAMRHRVLRTRCHIAGPGFEPELDGSEPSVLPLDDPAATNTDKL